MKIDKLIKVNQDDILAGGDQTSPKRYCITKKYIKLQNYKFSNSKEKKTQL